MVKGSKGLVLLDACCVINLFATGRVEEILESLPYHFAVARYVATREVLRVAPEETAAENPDSEPVNLETPIGNLIARRVLDELDVTSIEEQRELVRFATQLDDGEAHTCALAVVHGGRVATDDRKAIRILRSVVGGEEDPCLRTSQLLQTWSNEQGVGRGELARIIRSIARRASFLPPRSDPHFEWWMELLRSRG